MVKHLTLWTEWQHRTVMTPLGPAFADKGDTVIVIVAKDLEPKLLAMLVAQAPKDPE